MIAPNAEIIVAINRWNDYFSWGSRMIIHSNRNDSCWNDGNTRSINCQKGDHGPAR